MLVDGDRMPGASFFPDATLNFAENLLRQSGAADAIVFRGEDKVERRLSWDELRALVSRLQQAMRALGVKQGDRVAAMLPNMPETIAGMLAAASLGAIWSSCSPDFGVEGVLDRFGQIEPVLFIACDGYWYNGKQNDVSAKVKAVLARLPSVRSCSSSTICAPPQKAAAAIPRAVALDAGDRAVRAGRARLRAAAFRASALHPVLLRHDRRAEMHRPFGRRHAAPAPQGAPPAFRHRRRRPRLLFHHLRLDDVELAGVGARLGRDAAAL